MRGFGVFCLIVLAIVGAIAGSLVLHTCSSANDIAHKAIDVTAAQFDPETMLKRYEWFKDASASLDAKQADIQVYQNRFDTLKSDYGTSPRSQWSREDREQYNIWLSEVSGVQASYNMLAAEYNASMAKINYAFTNIGQLPRGADKPLPREYKPYVIK